MREQGYARSVLVVGLVIAGWAVANASPAAPKTNAPQQTGGGTNTGTGTGTGGGHKHGELLKALHHAHELLVHADHDYDGHRAKAVHLVTQAIHKLKPPAGTTTGTSAAPQTTVAAPSTGVQTPKSAPASGEAPKMTQEESDKHLHHASEILQKAQPLAQEHHAEAGAHLKDAIAEIATALSIK